MTNKVNPEVVQWQLRAFNTWNNIDAITATKMKSFGREVRALGVIEPDPNAEVYERWEKAGLPKLFVANDDVAKIWGIRPMTAFIRLEEIDPEGYAALKEQVSQELSLGIRGDNV